MLQNEESLFDLVGAIHLGAADPDGGGWMAAVQRLCEHMGGCSALIVDHVLPETISDMTTVEMDPKVVSTTKDTYGRSEKNPFIRSMPSLPVNVPLNLEQAMDADAFLRSKQYVEVLGPAGYRHWIAAVLDWNPQTSISMALARTERAGAFPDGHEDVLRRLLQHLAAASLVRRRLRAALAAAEAPRAVLQALDCGVILLDRVGRLVYANPIAMRILARRDGLALDRVGTVVCARPRDTGQLRQLISAASLAGAGRGLTSGGTLALPRASGQPYVVQVLPLAPENPLEGVPYHERSVVALLLADPEVATIPSESRLRRAYGLTHAEASLTALLVQGMNLREAADSLCISGNTAKTQLKSVFAKLEVDRQTALVRRVLADLGWLAAPPPTTNGNGAGHL
jgi:DNA-binding CsgD family transcriptional regulator